jgi:hypothetical protein
VQAAQDEAEKSLMPSAKRRRADLDNYWSTQGSLDSNVVIKKSRLQLEKEAAIRAQQLEKENELKEAFKTGGGIVVKIFDQAITS